METWLSRRIAVALAVAGLAGAEIGCARNGGDDGSSLSAGMAVSPITAAAPPDAPLALGAQLAAVRAATAAFHDISAAYAAGYTTNNEPCAASPAGAMGVHAPNSTLVGDQDLDPLRPEVLLYLPQPEGGYRLVGVEYLQIVLLRNPATGVVAPWFSPNPWPPEYEVVTPTPSLFGQTFQGPMPGHSPTMPWHWDLHVWVWAPNPSGTFAQWNPSLSCG